MLSVGSLEDKCCGGDKIYYKFLTFTKLGLFSFFRVPTCPGNPGNPGNVLELFFVLEIVLEMAILGEMSWNCPGYFDV